MDLQAAFETAKSHHQAGRLAEAEKLYREVLAQDPKHADALHFLGMLASQTGRHDDAIALIQRSIAAGGASIPHYHNNLGEAFRKANRLTEAQQAYRAAIALRPDYALAYYNLALVHALEGKMDQALEFYQRALAINPSFAEAHNNLGTFLHDRNQFDDAAHHLRLAIQFRPNWAVAHYNLANVLKDQGYISEAIECYRRAIALDPNFVNAHSSLVYCLYFSPDYDSAAILAEHRAWNKAHAQPLASQIRPHTNDRTVGRRLRIGYVSPDFRLHPVGSHLLAVLRSHDHAAFEIFCYSNVIKPTPITDRLRPLADTWRDTTALSDEQLTQLIRDDHIDILIDCTLHMANNRLLVFARKPAPIQVTYFGYPGTTGLSAIDFRITDPHLDPPGETDAHYSEKSIRLPDSFWCYHPMLETPEPGGPPSESLGHITFGCLNNFCKITTQAVELWGQIMRQVPHSRLLLLSEAGAHRRRIGDVLAAHQVSADRVEFAGFRPIPDYLRLYHQIDITLDSFPYNGHMTNLDSLFMGVPVVTLAGPTVVSRAGVSHLTNLGLSELIAHTPQQYIDLAVALARDPARLHYLHSSLRSLLQNSVLMDARRLTASLESAYRGMWERWCAAC